MRNLPYRFLSASKKIFSLLLVFSAVIFCSCGPEPPPKLVIGNDFYYWESTAESTYGEAMQHYGEFKKLEDKSTRNLRNTLGRGAHYVWIRAEFEIPPAFKEQPLGLVIPTLTFAEQLYLNGNFISMYGMFPPHEQSTLFKAHFFSFPLNVLKQEGKNIVLIKIYAQGLSGISSHAFIHPTRFAYGEFESINFNLTRIYMLFVGILIFTFILYISFYINVRAFREFMDFALLNFFTAIFLIPFFATELPIYTNGGIPFLLFMKLTMCIPPYFMVYFGTLFAVDFHHRKYSARYKIFRAAILILQVIPTLLAPNYETLTRMTPFMLILLALQGGIGAMITMQELISKKNRKTALEFILGFLPMSSTAVIDIVIRLLDNTQSYPFFSIFGWQISIAIFIVLLSTRFSTLYNRNKQLTDHLQDEVSSRTHELQDANYELSILNERLEKDKRHSEMDLEMASLVQKNFFPHPNRHFKGWEISVCYAPAAKVSGDFYDYYNYNDTLNGISLFDVSGHGLSASLVTMLSKNIISRMFQTGFRRKEPIDRVLSKINSMILSEKGDIDNYMTGILCRFEDDEESGKCGVELGNAGHPYPLKFSLRDNEIFELKGNDGKPHYGAIGMKGINTSFARSNFTMRTGDILILYTDGITEAANSKQEQFGLERIKAVIKNHHAKSSDELIGLIIEKLEEFTEYKPLEDDITLIIAKRKNPNEFVSEEEHYEELEDDVEELDEAEE